MSFNQLQAGLEEGWAGCNCQICPCTPRSHLPTVSWLPAPCSHQSCHGCSSALAVVLPPVHWKIMSKVCCEGSFTSVQPCPCAGCCILFLSRGGGINSLILCDNSNGGQRYSKSQILSIKLLQEIPLLSSAKEWAQIHHQIVDTNTLRLYELYEKWKAPLLIINNSRSFFFIHLVMVVFLRSAV